MVLFLMKTILFRRIDCQIMIRKPHFKETYRSRLYLKGVSITKMNLKINKFSRPQPIEYSRQIDYQNKALHNGKLTLSLIHSEKSKRMNVSDSFLFYIDSDEQIRGMQQSIRNISTNKKATRIRPIKYHKYTD